MIFITANSEENANAAANKMYYNYLMDNASNLEKLVGDGINDYFLSDLENMTEEEIYSLKLYGKRNGKIVKDGCTTEYAKPFTIENDPSFWVVCAEPETYIMENVINTTKHKKSSVTSITRSGNTATVIFDEDHNLSDGQKINVVGAEESNYNGPFNISILSANSVSYVLTGNPKTPATGSIFAFSQI